MLTSTSTAGDAVPLVRPPQGGEVTFVAARVRNFNRCSVQFAARFRDPATSVELAFDRRSTDLVVGADGWGRPDVITGVEPGERAPVPGQRSDGRLSRDAGDPRGHGVRSTRPQRDGLAVGGADLHGARCGGARGLCLRVQPPPARRARMCSFARRRRHPDAAARTRATCGRRRAPRSARSGCRRAAQPALQSFDRHCSADRASDAVAELGPAQRHRHRRVAPQRDVADGAVGARLIELRRLVAGRGRLVEVAEVRRRALTRERAALTERRQRLAGAAVPVELSQ